MLLAPMVARAGKIVDFFDKEAAAKGEGAVLYDFPRSQQACGVGLSGPASNTYRAVMARRHP